MAFDTSSIQDGGGIAFLNDYKNTDKHPDYRGHIKTPSGEVLEIAVWARNTKKGDPMLSFTVQVPREKKDDANTAQPVGAAPVKQDAGNGRPPDAAYGTTSNEDLPF